MNFLRVVLLAIVVCNVCLGEQVALQTLCESVPSQQQAQIFLDPPSRQVAPPHLRDVRSSSSKSSSHSRRLLTSSMMPLQSAPTILGTTSSGPIPMDALQNQCNAMATLHNLTSACGWRNSTNYRFDATDCCNWFGATCDSNGWLTSLVVSSNRLCGSIVGVQWDAFPYLVMLDLRRNQLKGPLPNDIGALSNLQHLYMSHNGLTSALPYSIGQLTNLVRIYLNDNLFNGTLPTSIANLTNLQQLDLHQNKITGMLPNLAGMNNLQMLFLYDNLLTSLPEDGWSSLPSLFYVDVSFNSIGGCLPSAMALAPMLQTIEAPNNLITCVDFNGFFNNPNSMITVVVLSNNKINGTASFLQIPQKLIYLDLSNNELIGWELGSTAFTSQMIHLNLANNSISTSLSDVSAQTNFNYLGYLDISNNNFAGALPPQFNALTKLTFLNITDSGLSRPIGGTSETDSLIFGVDAIFPANQNFHCFAIFLDLSDGFPPLAISVNNEYFHFNNCRCNQNFFGVPPICTPCLANGVCPGNNQQQYMFAQDGCYALPSPSNPKMFVPCSETPSANQVCNSTRILGHDPTPANLETFACAEGYTGRFCSQCDHTTTPMWFKAGDVCAICFSGKIVILLVCCYILALVGLMIYVYINTKSSESDLFSIVMFLVQTVGIVTRIGLDTPKLFQASTGGFSVTNFRFIGLECLLPGFYDYFGEILVTFLIPISFTVCVTIIYFVGKTFAKDRMSWKKRNQKALLLLLKTCYLPSAKAAFQALTCSSDPFGDKWVLRYQYVSCASPMYRNQVLPLALVMTILFIVGFPVFLFVFFYQRRQDIIRHAEIDKEDVVRFLIAPFRPTRFYWNIVVLLRSLFLAAVVSSISFTNVWLPLSVCIVLLSSFIMHTLLKPYKENLENWVEGASLSILILLFVLTLGMSSYSLTILNESGDSPDQNLNSWAAYALLFLCVLVVITPAVRAIQKMSKFIKEEVPHVANAGNRFSVALRGKLLQKLLVDEGEGGAEDSESGGGGSSAQVQEMTGVSSDDPVYSEIFVGQPLKRAQSSGIISKNKGIFWGM